MQFPAANAPILLDSIPPDLYNEHNYLVVKSGTGTIFFQKLDAPQMVTIGRETNGNGVIRSGSGQRRVARNRVVFAAKSCKFP